MLEKFGLDFELAKFDMQVGVSLRYVSIDGATTCFIEYFYRSLSMNYLESGQKPTAFISSEQSGSQELVKVKYTRVQPESPEFATIYESINQSVDVEFSTIVLRAQPEPVVAMYDFMMSTFVNNGPKPTPKSPPVASEHAAIALPAEHSPSPSQTSVEQIRVNVKLQGVEGKPFSLYISSILTSFSVILMNLGANIAKLDLSKAAVSLLLRGNALKIAGRLDDISITDEISPEPKDPQFKQILHREGDHFADFTYETFDPSDKETFQGINSVVTLRTASLKFNFLENPLHEVYVFLLKLARLKGLYDAATQAAAQSVSEITRMRFDVLISSPIIVFPKNPNNSNDALVMKLGEIGARNSYEGPIATTEASLQGIGLTSQSYVEGKLSVLKMIDDVLITATVVQTEGIDHASKPDLADTKVYTNKLRSEWDTQFLQIAINVSDIKLGLTQRQYCDLIALSQVFGRIVTSPLESEEAPVPVQAGPEPPKSPPLRGALNAPEDSASSATAAALEPEIAISSRLSLYPTLDLELKIVTIKLQLFDESALSEDQLRSCGIARFALNGNSVRFKQFSNGAGEAEVILKSFTVSNTRPGPSKFREIIPAARHDRNQFMVLFTMSGGKESSSLAIVTIESPKLLFTLDPVFALANFCTSAFTAPRKPSPTEKDTKALTTVRTKSNVEPTPKQPESSLAFRVDLNDVSVTLLENDSDANSQAVRLSIQQVMMSQQVNIVT